MTSLRRMYEEYAKQGKFYDESNGIRAVIEEVTGNMVPEDFFRRAMLPEWMRFLMTTSSRSWFGVEENSAPFNLRTS